MLVPWAVRATKGRKDPKAAKVHSVSKVCKGPRAPWAHTRVHKVRKVFVEPKGPRTRFRVRKAPLALRAPWALGGPGVPRAPVAFFKDLKVRRVRKAFGATRVL